MPGAVAIPNRVDRAVAAVASLRRIAALVLERGDTEMVDQVRGMLIWLALETDDQTRRLEGDLGLHPGWRDDCRRACRDRALLDLRDRYFPALKGRTAALAVGGAVRRYERAGWPRDCRSRRRPDGVKGAAYDCLAYGEIPGDDTLRRLFKQVAGEREALPIPHRD